MCLQLLPKLRADAHDNWGHLVTGYETWFYYKDDRNGIWTGRDDNMPEIENRNIVPEQYPDRSMESHGLHVVTILPPRASFNALWFIDGDLVFLVETFLPVGWSAGEANW
jgi:hypothetical protein